MFKEWLTRLRFLIVSKPHREVDEELKFHVKRQIQANLAAGMAPQEAHRQAIVVFGGSREQGNNLTNNAPATSWRHLFKTSATVFAASVATRSSPSP
jgi:putative ABC transport system permease protein